MANNHSKKARRRLRGRSRWYLKAKLFMADPTRFVSPDTVMSKEAKKYNRYLRNLALIRSVYKISA